jgi:ATP-binding cassette subfamily B protein
VQFVIYAVMVAGAVGSLTEVWGEVQRAAGRDRAAGGAPRLGDSVQDPPAPGPRAEPAPREMRLEA